MDYVDDNVAWVPASLEKIPPGAVLAAMLDDINLDASAGHDRVRVSKALERMRSHYAALSLRTMTAVMDSLDETDMPADTIEDATWISSVLMY